MAEYYVQKGLIGQDAAWWKKNDHGYTANIDDAKVFTEEEALEKEKSIDKRYKKWPKVLIDLFSEKHATENILITLKLHEEGKL